MIPGVKVWILYFFKNDQNTQKVEAARPFVNTIEIQQDLVLQESCTLHQEVRHDNECRRSAVKFQSLHSITILTSFVAIFKKDKTTVHSMRKKTHQLEYNLNYW